MSKDLVVLDASLEHILDFLSRPIRQEDVDEWFAASGGKPIRKTLLDAFEAGPIRALVYEGRCVCLWGAVPMPEGMGLVWLIAGVEAEGLARGIHRLWPQEIAALHAKYGHLVAVAYGYNEFHTGWLRTIGFEPVHTQYVGPGMLPFITHVRRAPCATQ